MEQDNVLGSAESRRLFELLFPTRLMQKSALRTDSVIFGVWLRHTESPSELIPSELPPIRDSRDGLAAIQ
jgi:hypothetical protein